MRARLEDGRELWGLVRWADGNLFGVLGASGVHPERVLVTPERVAAWRRRGALVHTWTVNDPAEAARLARSGVDGIISDHPALILKQL